MSVCVCVWLWCIPEITVQSNMLETVFSAWKCCWTFFGSSDVVVSSSCPSAGCSSPNLTCDTFGWARLPGRAHCRPGGKKQTLASLTTFKCTVRRASESTKLFLKLKPLKTSSFSMTTCQLNVLSWIHTKPGSMFTDSVKAITSGQETTVHSVSVGNQRGSLWRQPRNRRSSHYRSELNPLIDLPGWIQWAIKSKGRRRILSLPTNSRVGVWSKINVHVFVSNTSVLFSKESVTNKICSFRIFR